MVDERSELTRLRKLKRLRELEARAVKQKPAAEMKRPTALGGLGYQPEEEASRQAFRAGAANVPVPETQPQRPKAPTRLGAVAGQFAQSATLGQGPNILAAPYALTGQFPEAKAFYQQRLQQGAQAFPVSTAAADIAGFIAPAAGVAKGVTMAARPAVNVLARAIPSTGLTRMGGRIAAGAGLGATEGALYGGTVEAERRAMQAGQAGPTMEERGQAALPAAGLGAVVGGALPVVGRALQPVGTAIAGQAVKAFGPGATARQAERVAQKAVRADLQRAGINNLDDFLKAAEQYQGKPAMTGELAQSTLNTLTALVRGKGTTGDKVQAILADRVAGFPARMMRDLETSTGLKADEILGDVDAMVKAARETATPQYDIAKAAPFKVSTKLQNLIDRSPTVQQAVEAARGVIADKAAASGRAIDEIPPLEFYDEVKQQIDRIEFSGRKMGDKETRQIDEVRRAFVAALDEIVPGAYAAARKAGSEAPKVREAVKLGQNSYTKPLEQVAADISQMDDAAAKAYRGAFVTNLVNKIRMGQLKPAALRAPNLRDKMALLFGDDAADQLVTKFSQEFDLLKKGSRLDPNVGSVTSQALLGMPDQALDDLLNAGSSATAIVRNTLAGNVGEAARLAIQFARRAGYTEAQQNAIGDLLMSDPERAAKLLFPNEMARLGASARGATAQNVLAKPTQAPKGGRNTLAMPPELGGAFVGGALGGTQGETAEERARNALLGAVGGAVGGRLASRAAIDRTRMGSNLGNVPKPVQKAQAQGYEGADIGEAQEWVSARAKGLDMSQEGRLKRAQKLGFDTGQVLYHGTGTKGIKAFDINRAGSVQYSDWGPGIYFEPNKGRYGLTGADYYRAEAAKKQDPRYIKAFQEYEAARGTAQQDAALKNFQDIAAEITRENMRGEGGGEVIEAFVRMKNPYRYTPTDNMPDITLAERVKAQGYDGIQILNPDGSIDEVVIFDPANIRSVNAAFDPASKESANILAGVGAVGAGAAMMPREAEAQTVGSERRPDGTKKGLGYFGEIPITFPNGDTGVATEYSTQSQAVKVDGKMIDFPTLVPTLTPDEVRMMATDIIPNRKPIPETIMQKAIAHARKRLAAGQSVYADQKKPPGQRPRG